MRNFPTSGAILLEEMLCVHLLQSVPASPLQGLSGASSLCATSAAGGGRAAARPEEKPKEIASQDRSMSAKARRGVNHPKALLCLRVRGRWRRENVWRL